MASTVPLVPNFSETKTKTPCQLTCIKAIAESTSLPSIPSAYIFTTNPHADTVSEDPEETIPTIDFSFLTSGTSDQRTKVIHELAKACKDWGFFTVINHGVPESLMREIMDGCIKFFDQTEEEKRDYEGKNVLDPIRCGTSFNAAVDKVLFWRDYLKVMVHPKFHFPNKPAGFSELSLEYCKRTRVVARELLKGISESLGLEDSYIEKALNFESGLQIFIANLYPPCPQPELAMGMPPHSDHGLLTLLIQNGVGGLQLQHNDKWVNVNAIPNAFLVNIGDHLQITSNGRYKSVLHRAVVNNKFTRLSLAIANGPSLDTIVSPAAELVDNHNHPPAYIGMKYKDYLDFQQSNRLQDECCLDRVRV